MIRTGVHPANPRGTYITFDKMDDVVIARMKLQIQRDAPIRIEFDTMQILDDVNIPHGDFGKAGHFEPLTKDFPQWGNGGATQAVTRQPIQVRRIVDLRTGRLLYGQD